MSAEENSKAESQPLGIPNLFRPGNAKGAPACRGVSLLRPGILLEKANRVGPTGFCSRIRAGVDVCLAKPLRAAARDRRRASPASSALLLRWRDSRPPLQLSAPDAMDRRIFPK